MDAVLWSTYSNHVNSYIVRKPLYQIRWIFRLQTNTWLSVDLSIQGTYSVFVILDNRAYRTALTHTYTQNVQDPLPYNFSKFSGLSQNYSEL